MQLQLRQGRHHQIRRLCKRAGLRLLHLRRLSVGLIALGGMAPGEVRELFLNHYKPATMNASLTPYEHEPVAMQTTRPPQVRELSISEKAQLYEACLPGGALHGAHARRASAMAAARARAVAAADAPT